MIRHLLKLVWCRKRANALLVLEIFASFLVLFAVSTFGLILLNRVRHPIGFSYENLYTVSIDEREVLDDAGVEVEKQKQRTARLMQELRALDQVEAVAGMTISPFELGMAGQDLEYEGRSVGCRTTRATDDAAEVLGIKVVYGRWFGRADDARDWTPVVVNRRLVDQLFGDEDPLGKIVNEEPQMRVVGVVEEFRKGGYLASLQPFFIRRISLDRERDQTPRRIMVKVSPSATAEIEERVLRRLQRVEPQWKFNIELTDSIRIRNQKFLLAGFIIATLVAAFMMMMVVSGLIGVFWQTVTQRIGEIGLRRALGGARASIYRQMLAEILIVTSIGSLLAMLIVVQLPLLGLLGSLGWPMVLQAMLVATAIMFTLATISGLYPAWTAARIQPADALHDE
jgi:putative ABC transport system permease protein